MCKYIKNILQLALPVLYTCSTKYYFIHNQLLVETENEELQKLLICYPPCSMHISHHLSIDLPTAGKILFEFNFSNSTFFCLWHNVSDYAVQIKIMWCKSRRPCLPVKWSMVTNSHHKFLIEKALALHPKWGGMPFCCPATLPRSWCSSISGKSVLCRCAG